MEILIKQKTAYEMRMSDWSSDVCSSDLCHASARDLDNKDDLRIKMCTKVNGDDFVTIHHELGHTYYQRAYNQQPLLYMNEIGRASCRERVCQYVSIWVVPGTLKTTVTFTFAML